jgi:predicted nuclease of predicted toxin-antitoxin system
MKLVADESIDLAIVEALRQDGHDVTYVAEMSPSISDDEVLDEANQSGAVLFTADKDFGELVFRQGRLHTGIVLIRLAGLGPRARAVLVSEAANLYGAKFVGTFSVISPGQIRIRSSP